MAHKRKRFREILIILLFLVYFFLAARPIPKEIILAPKWISSLESSSLETSSLKNPNVQSIDDRDLNLFPFLLGSHYGYIDSDGKFAVNRDLSFNIYLGRNMWTEYDAQPDRIEIKDILEEPVINIENPGGYPVLLDDRVFILGSDQNSLSEIDKNGKTVWKYEFGAPLTCMDAKAGLVLTGSLDGIIEIFNSAGERIFHFAPGGSRYEVILGCAISHDGSRIGIISGIDRQRFLFLERAGNINDDYKVIYHEYLDTGFRRPVRVIFIDEDKRVIYERTDGVGFYNIKNRRALFIPLEGDIYTCEESGDQGFLFIVTSSHDSMMSEDGNIVSGKELIGIRFPRDRWFPFSYLNKTNPVFLRAPFKSDDAFLGRNSGLVVGGGTVLISFDLEEK